MKKYLKWLLSLFIILTIAGGCKENPLSTITQQVPFTKDVAVIGSGTSIEQSGSFNLSESDFYNANSGKISNIEFLKLSFKTTSVNPPDQPGNLKLILKQPDGTVLLQTNMPGKPSDYIAAPYEFNIPQAQVQLINNYLATGSNLSIVATIIFDTQTEGVKVIVGQLFIVFQMDYKP